MRGRAGVMAALCGSHAGAAGSRFLRALLFSKPFRKASTESGSESAARESSAPRARSGGFASALERISELQRKAELGPVSGPRAPRPDAGPAWGGASARRWGGASMGAGPAWGVASMGTGRDSAFTAGWALSASPGASLWAG